MGVRVDLTGQRFGKLVAIKPEYQITNDGTRKAAWLCRCDCGNEKIITTGNLKNGTTKSCGCGRYKGMTGEKNPMYQHGESHGWLYGRWRTMKRRCYEPGVKGYERYGGRGIRVCDEWLNSYEAFARWAKENGCRQDLTIDRIDVNGDYTPDNCRWITNKEQCRNKRNNVRFEYDGKNLTLPEWAELTGVSKSALKARIINGWQFEDAITLPFNGKRYRGVRTPGHRSTNRKKKAI